MFIRRKLLILVFNLLDRLPVRVIKLIAKILTPYSREKEEVIYHISSLATSKSFFRYSYSSTDDSKSLGKQLQIICVIDEKNFWGLTDRLRGCISIFRYCQLNNYDFKIYFKHPFDLEWFLLPNKYDWRIDEMDISYDKKFTYSFWLGELNGSFKNLDSCQKESLDWICQKKHLRQLHLYTNTQFLIQNYSEDFNSLFTKSPYLESHLSKHKELLQNKYISISFRFINLLGDSEENVMGFHVLTELDRTELIGRCIAEVEQIKLRNPNINRFLITSDSNCFLERCSNLASVYIVQNKHYHMGYTDMRNKEHHLKPFLDLYMIAGAQIVYQVKLHGMYKSGFPEKAALIYNRPYVLIEK